jgi:hypothetical protein
MTPLLHKTITYPGGKVSLLDTLIYITVDSSGGADETSATTRTDKVGWCVNAVDMYSNWFILELQAAHLSDEQFIQRLFELDDKYLPHTFGIELMPHLATVMRLQFKLLNRSLKIVELKHGRRNKADRITRLRPLLKNTYFLDQNHAHIQHRLRNWYTEQEHDDDDLDAFGYQIDIAHAPTPDSIVSHRKQRQERLEEMQLLRLPPAERTEWKKWMEYDRRKGLQHIDTEMAEFLA